MSFNREPNAEPIPGYRLIEPLGNGGFGEVWKCEAPGGVHKAVKFVFGNLDSMDVDGARAEQEQKALGHIKEVRHPFVVQVDRIDVVKGELVIVMELADRSLHDAFEDCRASGLVGIPRDQLMSYLRDAAEALDHMNEVHKLQHLDVKPRNLFIVSNRVKVADFGLVKTIERSGNSGMMSSVTPLYAPPETLKGDVSPHSDQYSLAIVYQEMLTGHRPFNGKNVRQLAHQHLNEPPDLRTLPECERGIVGKALSKDPLERFPSCLAFVRALYSSRVPTHSAGASSGRPKTMTDTLESFQLGVPDGFGPMGEGEDYDGDAPGLNESNEAVSNLGVTVAQPTTGALRPTLIVGVGGFGRRAMMELRCRLLDRFGDLEKVPLLRFLYLDTDGDAVKAAQRGAAEIAFRPYEVFHLPLQPQAHYRKRHADQLADWLPRVKQHNVPRSLKTQGSRALGRLAYTDTYQRLVARLKREIATASHPDAIYQTVLQTGLALRDDTPRVYVLAGATGGGSGFLADLAYTIRRQMQQSSQPLAPITGFLFCGAPDDPATPQAEHANLYATLTELNHFGTGEVPFSAQYGMDGPQLRDQGPGFDQVYLVTQRHRSADDRRDALAHAGSYLFHELTTPLGPRLDQARQRRKATAFRSMGTFGVWFPRGLMLRMAARDAVVKLMDEWRTPGTGLTSAEQAVLDAALARVLTDPDLRADALTARIDAHVAEALDATAKQSLQKLLVTVEEQSLQHIAQDDPGAWARQMLTKVQDWLGSGIVPPGVNIVQQRRSQLTRALEAASAALTAEWAKRIRVVVDRLTETPGRRLALAEAAVARLARFCDESVASTQARVNQTSKSRQLQEQVQQALQNCVTGIGGWSLFGGRSRRLVRVFVDHLAAFARQCLADDLAGAAMHFFGSLRGRLNDLGRDLGYAHKRLKNLQDTLTLEVDDPEAEENVSDTATFMRTPGQAGGVAFNAPGSTGTSQTPLLSTESYWQAIRGSQTARVVLPDGESDLGRSARRFLASLNAENWQHLDQVLGDEVLSARGGLLRLCLDGGDVVRDFLSPMLSHAITCLSDHLPITDVAQVEHGGDARLYERIVGYHLRAAPPLRRTDARPAGRVSGVHARVGSGVRPAVAAVPAEGELPPEQFSFLLVPASEAGRGYGEQAKQAVSSLTLVNVPGQADLMFCREQGSLRLEDLERILLPCRNAYHELCLNPLTSPHARFDIHDWTPLDP